MSGDINISAPLESSKMGETAFGYNFTADHRNKRHLLKRAGVPLAKLPRLFKESED